MFAVLPQNNPQPIPSGSLKLRDGMAAPTLSFSHILQGVAGFPAPMGGLPDINGECALQLFGGLQQVLAQLASESSGAPPFSTSIPLFLKIENNGRVQTVPVQLNILQGSSRAALQSFAEDFAAAPLSKSLLAEGTADKEAPVLMLQIPAEFQGILSAVQPEKAASLQLCLPGEIQGEMQPRPAETVSVFSGEKGVSPLPAIAAGKPLSVSGELQGAGIVDSSAAEPRSFQETGLAGKKLSFKSGQKLAWGAELPLSAAGKNGPSTVETGPLLLNMSAGQKGRENPAAPKPPEIIPGFKTDISVSLKNLPAAKPAENSRAEIPQQFPLQKNTATIQFKPAAEAVAARSNADLKMNKSPLHPQVAQEKQDSFFARKVPLSAVPESPGEKTERELQPFKGRFQEPAGENIQRQSTIKAPVKSDAGLPPVFKEPLSFSRESSLVLVSRFSSKQAADGNKSIVFKWVAAQDKNFPPQMSGFRLDQQPAFEKADLPDFNFRPAGHSAPVLDKADLNAEDLLHDTGRQEVKPAVSPKTTAANPFPTEQPIRSFLQDTTTVSRGNLKVEVPFTEGTQLKTDLNSTAGYRKAAVESGSASQEPPAQKEKITAPEDSAVKESSSVPKPGSSPEHHNTLVSEKEMQMPGVKMPKSAPPTAQTLPRTLATDMIRELTRQIQSAVIHQKREIILQLKPESLGLIRMRLKMEDNRLSGRVEVASGEVHSLLSRHTPELLQRLQENNIQVERFDLELSGEAAGGGQEQAAGSHQNNFGNKKGMALGFDEKPLENLAVNKNSFKFSHSTFEYIA
ncbi:MAG: flagellar hook-length control protein FliK [Calditrichia bacterium]